MLFWCALGAELILFAALNLFGDWTLEAMPIKFVAVAILSGLAYLVAAGEFPAAFPSKKNGVEEKNSQARAPSQTRLLWIFWTVTIALRLLALPLPVSDELARARADGLLQRVQLNPYLTSPDRISDLSVIHADESAAYAPGTEIIFRVLPANRGPFLYKFAFGLAESLAAGLLLRFLGPTKAAWFAWNPLLAFSFAGAAHFDAVFILALVTLAFSLTRNESWRWSFAASAALGFAIAIRPVAIVLLLPCIFALRRRAGLLLLAIAIPLALAAIFGNPGAILANLFGDFTFGRLNDLFWWVVEETVLPNYHQRLFRYDLVILIVATVVAVIFRRDWPRSLLWCFGVVLILAPVLHAWYVLWILPFATWRGAYAWHILSVTIFAYYLFYNERLFALPWHAEPWLRGVIILPVLFVLMTKALAKSKASSPLPG